MHFADIPHFTLLDGTKIPSVGMGCWMGTPGGGQRVYDMCALALKNGYRHFDTASGYQNEEEVGRAIRDSGVKREDVFVTTKLGNGAHHRVREAFDDSLGKLGLDYVDLYLMHWPQASVDGKTLQPDESPTIVETWKEMEKLLETGKCKTIGVSNFGVPLLEQLLKEAKVVPATNQVELHPCLPLQELQGLCASKGIVITAYSPLGQPKDGQPSPFMTDDVVTSIAKRLDAAPAQVVLSWAVGHRIVVVPKSENNERMQANIALVKLTHDDMRAIDDLHKQPGMHRSLLGYHSPDGTVFGWTYKQLGWNLTTGGVVPSES